MLTKRKYAPTMKHLNKYAVAPSNISHLFSFFFFFVFKLFKCNVLNKTHSYFIFRYWRKTRLRALFKIKNHNMIHKQIRNYLQELGIFHPKSSTQTLRLFPEVKCTILHCCSFINQKLNPITSLQYFLYILHHYSSYLNRKFN